MPGKEQLPPRLPSSLPPGPAVPLPGEGTGEGRTRHPAAYFLQGGRLPLWFCAVLLALGVSFFYLPVLKNGFVNWDDNDTITDNLLIRRLDLDSLRAMFTTFPTGNWIPLTWLSFALDYHWGGLDPRVFHATNVLLHALNTVLVFLACLRLLRRLPGPVPGDGAPLPQRATWVALTTALLFGLHPIHVESVAWASERKDVLYSFFYLAALGLYLDGPLSCGWRTFKPWACLGLYLLALLSKPMAVTLPLVFLILDYWPLGRWGQGLRALLKEKAPFFAVAAGAVWITLASHAKTLSYARSGIEFYWIMNSFRSLAFYPLKMACPTGLTAYYPFPPHLTGFYMFENFCAAGAVILVSVLLYRARRRAPFLWAAWLFYTATLLPVVGIIQTGSEAAADRYTYLSSLGFFLPFSAGAVLLFSRRRALGAAATALAVVLMGMGTAAQIGTWRDSTALWARVTEVYPAENPAAYSELGSAYLKAHRYDEALAAYIRATSFPPPLAEAYSGLGAALMYKDRIPEAVRELRYAIELDPRSATPHLNLWVIDEHLGLHQEAAAQMGAALRIEPGSADFHNKLGVSDCFLKKYGDARDQFERAHALDPVNPEYLVNLATIYQWQGRPGKALEWYRRGIRRDPRQAVYHLKMADIYLSQGLRVRALESLRKAWDLHPANPKLLRQMGEDFEKAGRPEEARQCLDRVGAGPQDSNFEKGALKSP